MYSNDGRPGKWKMNSDFTWMCDNLNILENRQNSIINNTNVLEIF